MKYTAYDTYTQNEAACIRSWLLVREVNLFKSVFETSDTHFNQSKREFGCSLFRSVFTSTCFHFWHCAVTCTVSQA